ncbi:MAG: protein kinase [Chloroflexus sp.]
MTCIADDNLVGNRFRPIRYLAQTAHSIIQFAYDTQEDQDEADRLVVIKRLALTSAGKAATHAIRAFMREVEILRYLSDQEREAGRRRRFPRLIEAGRDNQGYYFVQNFFTGPTLADVLAAGRPNDAIKIAVNLCWALRLLHAYGIIHGDLNPQNIIVGNNSEVALIDFGKSRFRYQKASELIGIGWSRSMSAEQLLGGPNDEWIDLVALSQILQELLDLNQLPDLVRHLATRMRKPSPDQLRRMLAALQAELEAIKQWLPPKQVQNSLQPNAWQIKVLLGVATIIIAIFVLSFWLR